MAHITGGGITENLPRVLPAGCDAEVATTAWTVPPIFRLIQERGRIAAGEMARAFNMGIGLIVVTAAEDAGRAIAGLEKEGERPCRLGHIVAGSGVVRYTS
jgi:phosphoribosylformylglycinamidine cyclo-ligase